MSDELVLSSSVAQTTALSIPPGGITSTSIAVNYTTMNGNQPNSYKNSIALYQSGPDLPWNTKPLNIQANPNDNQDGSFNFDGLAVQNKSYLLAYAVGNDAGSTEFPLANVCTTVYIPAGSGDNQNHNDFLPSISIVSVGTDSLIVAYNMPPGQTPQTCGHYLALWESSTYSYNQTPMKVQPITADQSTRTQAWNGLTLLRGTTYTIAYVAGKKQTDLACAVTFATS